MGGPTELLRRTFSLLANIIQRNAPRPEFIAALSMLMIETKVIYPSGISRAS
jgi:hypothetical protein